MDITTIYNKRFSAKERKERDQLWKTLCRLCFQKYVNKNDVIIDMGAGFCEFINNVKCRKKIAVDINPEVKNNAKKDVFVLNCLVEKIPRKYYGIADVIFMSNFLEHLSSKDKVVEVLEISYKLLKPYGKIIIMQPNIDLAKERYWDHIDHHIALNGKSVVEALEITGFKLEEFVKRFLPLTTKSILPKMDIFVKAYFMLPSFIRPLAGQSLFVAVRKSN